jgi:hypothetical protein
VTRNCVELTAIGAVVRFWGITQLQKPRDLQLDLFSLRAPPVTAERITGWPM